MYGKPLNLTIQVGKKYPELAIAAEFKRASPSKGNINIDLDAVTQCLEYADAGATIISVLTEFLHFKGTLSDLKKVRISTQNIHKENRPAILRKDFILRNILFY
jgi:indole-3-glycerol phosphate synthase